MATATKSAPNAASPAAAFDQLLTGIRQSQQFALDATKAWAEMAGKAFSPQSAFSAIPTIPGAPTAADVQDAVGAGFGLVHEAVAAQQALVEQVLAAFVTPAPPVA